MKIKNSHVNNNVKDHDNMLEDLIRRKVKTSVGLNGKPWKEVVKKTNDVTQNNGSESRSSTSKVVSGSTERYIWEPPQFSYMLENLDLPESAPKHISKKKKTENVRFVRYLVPLVFLVFLFG